MGNGEVLSAGEFQCMSAGTGITHSEFNPSATDPTHLYQIWLIPEREGIEPQYEQKRFDNGQAADQLRLVAAPGGVDGSLRIHQDAQIYLGRLAANQQVSHELAPGRHAWLQVLRGAVTLRGDHQLETSDGAAISDETLLDIRATDDAEIMLFDLA